MCGRFVAATDPDGLVRFFVIDERKGAGLPASYNVAPTDPVHAVAEHRGRRLLVTLRWGLVPRWAPDRRIASRLINARAETAADKPAFRDAFVRRRCLVPADGFYEWQRRDGGAPVPHYIRHAGGVPLAFAGLWDVWRDPAAPEAAPLRTCTILTTGANPLVRPLHGRMPVILPREHWDAWLDRDGDPSLLHGLLSPCDADLLSCHPVSRSVNRPEHNHPGLLDPV